MRIEDRKQAQILAENVRRLYDSGLTTMSGGNLSIRDEKDNIWVTPSGLDKGCLTEKDMMCVAADGTVFGNTKVTSEFVVHKAILDKRKDKNAVLHAHSPIVLGFSTARFKPNENLIAASAERMGDRITISPYQRAGSPQLAEVVSSHLEGETVVTILENHGLFMVGNTMEECYANLELLELAGHVELQANILGKCVKEMSKEDKMLFAEKKIVSVTENEKVAWTSGDEATANKITFLMKRMYSRNINTAVTGSFSVKMPDGSIMITPQGIDVRSLKAHDIVKVENGECEKGKIPNENYKLHEEIYAENPEISTIIMAVPQYLMTYAVSDAEFLSEPVWEAYYLLREIPKLPFGRGTEFHKKVAESFGERVPTLLIENDCYIVTSNDIMDAYDKVEVAEATAKGTILTSAVKPPVAVEKEIIEMYDRLIHKMLFEKDL